ncbi:MAG: DUF5615 family PIN-like protein [Deltaproteobacteria bacterium]|nr:DUF5615 family PIN-like protein [Deltaproteobacteria bacterium]MBI3018009.1 DUF5615 family PIN-like protein [Deltaproteobacteria bacterium]
MGLKFFIDHCVPNSFIESLTDEGHEVLKLKDFLPTNTADIKVIEKAFELKAILISLNGDFADILSYPPQNYNGIIAIQFQNQPKLQGHILGRLKPYFKDNPTMSHYKGKLFVAEPHRIRIWE